MKFFLRCVLALILGLISMAVMAQICIIGTFPALQVLREVMMNGLWGDRLIIIGITLLSCGGGYALIGIVERGVTQTLRRRCLILSATTSENHNDPQ